MFGLPSPWMILAFIFVLAGSYSVGHHKGYVEKETEDAIVIGHKDQQMNDVKEKADADLKQAQDQLTATQKKLSDAIRTGNQRLYVRVATPIGCSSTASGDTTTTAQLDPEFAQSLVAITDRGDQAIVQLNACIAQYDKIREIVNARR